jgi:hypothetical protein
MRLKYKIQKNRKILLAMLADFTGETLTGKNPAGPSYID